MVFFNVEGVGSHRVGALYVDGLSDLEQESISLNINLDSVAGSPNLTALTSGYAGLGPYLGDIAGANNLDLRCHLPLMVNSDHCELCPGGIPAFRLVAGFDEPDANLCHVLTPMDTRDMVSAEELRRAALLDNRHRGRRLQCGCRKQPRPGASVPEGVFAKRIQEG